MVSLSPTTFFHMLSPSSSFSHGLSSNQYVCDTLLNISNFLPVVTEAMNDRQTTKVPSPSLIHSTIKQTSFLISSTSTFVIPSSELFTFLYYLFPYLATLLTPTTQPSASFLVGGIIVAVVCIILVCTCLLIVACIIVCVKKRTKFSSTSNPDDHELSTSIKILTTSTNDDHDTNIDTLQDNPAYASTTGFTSGSTTLQDNPAYTSTNNTVSVNDDTLYMYASYNSSNLYSTILNPNEINNEYT